MLAGWVRAGIVQIFTRHDAALCCCRGGIVREGVGLRHIDGGVTVDELMEGEIVLVPSGDYALATSDGNRPDVI